MSAFLLVVNAGSSSIKFTVYQMDTPSTQSQLLEDCAGQIEGINGQPRFLVKKTGGGVLVDDRFSSREANGHADAIALVLGWLVDYFGKGELLAVGHRIVHGGQHYSAPVLLNEKILDDLDGLVPLAPLHQPHNLATVRALQSIKPAMPQVGCFDTAFHCTQPEVARRIALPRRFADEGIRRYGFHGLSYEFIASMLPSLDPGLARARVIVAHLGSGASLCALQNGRSMATTMGFSPLDGLVMGTRCGSIDPGVLLYLMGRHDMDVEKLQALLYFQSGLLGVSGISNDMRTLLDSDAPYAKQAIELFVYRIGREIGSLAAALGGVDALVFTGGIGEHAAPIRAQVARQAAWLGLDLDEEANRVSAACISKPGSKLSAWVLATDENLMIARHTIKLIPSARVGP